MHLEINKRWGLVYYEDIKWYPYCRKHEDPKTTKRPIKDCMCVVPRHIWKKMFFMDQLEKFK